MTTIEQCLENLGSAPGCFVWGVMSRRRWIWSMFSRARSSC